MYNPIFLWKKITTKYGTQKRLTNIQPNVFFTNLVFFHGGVHRPNHDCDWLNGCFVSQLGYALYWMIKHHLGYLQRQVWDWYYIFIIYLKLYPIIWYILLALIYFHVVTNCTLSLDMRIKAPNIKALDRDDTLYTQESSKPDNHPFWHSRHKIRFYYGKKMVTSPFSTYNFGPCNFGSF